MPAGLASGRRQCSALGNGRAVATRARGVIIVVAIISILFAAGCSPRGASDGAAEDVQRIVQATGAIVRHREMLVDLPFGDPVEVVRRYVAARSELTEGADELREVATKLPNQTYVLAIRLLDDESEAWSYMELEALTDRAEYEELAGIFFAAVDAGWFGLLDDLSRFAESEKVEIEFSGLDLPRRTAIDEAGNPASDMTIVIPPPSTPTNTPIPRPFTPSRPPTPSRAEAGKVTGVAQESVEARQRTRTPETGLGGISPIPVASSVTAAAANVLTDLEPPPARVTVATPIRPDVAGSPPAAETATSGPTIEAQPDTGNGAAPTLASAVTQATDTPRSYSDADEWTQGPVVVRFHDWLGASAFVSHWIVAAAPDSVTVVNHPLADNDVVQVDIMVTSEGKLESLSAFSVVSATGAVFPSTPLNGHYRLTGLKVSGGLHTFVFENAGDSRSKTVHLLVTQHKIAPGAKGP